MNQDWKTFLQQQANPADSQRLPDCAITDLSSLGLIRVQGKDARSFLQGQLSNDINNVSLEKTQFSSYCSHKGRMFASIRIFERPDGLYLQLPLERLEAILKRLGMFVLMSKVELTDASDELVRIGLAGDCSASLLPEVPGEDYAAVQQDQLTIIRLPADRPRYEVIGPTDAVIALWQQASEQASVADEDFWPLMDIRAGIPNILNDTAEEFVPQMANLHLLDGISFTKGCYTGQEVVARMHYLGKLKKRLYLGHLDVTEQPQIGAELFSASSTSGQWAGRIVDARPSPEGGYELLMVAQISSAEEGDLALGKDGGAQVQLRELPYKWHQDTEQK